MGQRTCEVGQIWDPNLVFAPRWLCQAPSQCFMNPGLLKILVNGDVGIIAIPAVSLKKRRPRKCQYLARTIHFPP